MVDNRDKFKANLAISLIFITGYLLNILEDRKIAD